MKLRQHYALILGTLAVLIVIAVSAVIVMRHGHIEAQLQQSSFTAMSESLFHENENAARALTTALTKSLVEPVALDNFEDIANVAKSSRKLPRVSELQVFDAQGLLIHDGTDEISGFGTPVSPVLLEDVYSDIHIKLQREENILKVCAPIRVDKRVLGGIYIEFKLDEVNAHIQELKQELESIIETNKSRNILITILLALVLSLLAILVGIFVSRYLSRPILTLSEQARNIGHGRYEIDSKLSGRPDELGELAQSIRWMANELSNHTYSKSQLENLVQIRTNELEIANEKLLNVDENRREFLTDLGHELRTPLAAIRGISEVRLRSDKNICTEENIALTRIVKLCEQVGALVDDLLFIARSESGKPELNITAFPLCDLISTVVQQIEHVANENDIKIQLLCEKDSVIDGDPRRIKQLFTILIDNAIKYSNPRGVVSIDISFRSEHKQDYADVKIVDTGIGMTDTELEQSNIRFFRGTRAKLKHKKGMGLGLSIAKAIMQTHGLKFHIDSNINCGTTVLVSFALNNDSIEKSFMHVSN